MNIEWVAFGFVAFFLSLLWSEIAPRLSGLCSVVC
jgi:hypothetical protein